MSELYSQQFVGDRQSIAAESPSTGSTLAQRAPLPKGAVIEFCGEQGKVIHDAGGEGRVTVDLGDHTAKWWWAYEGVTCTVVALPRAC